MTVKHSKSVTFKDCYKLPAWSLQSAELSCELSIELFAELFGELSG